MRLTQVDFMRNKSREEHLCEILLEYKRRYRPIAAFLLVKEQFMDIIGVEQKYAVDGKWTTIFTDDEWLRFKEKLIHSMHTQNVDGFVDTYWNKRYKFDFKWMSQKTANSVVQVLSWTMNGGAWGTSPFEKPGCLFIFDEGDYWVILFFSMECFGDFSCDLDQHAIHELVAALNASDKD